MGIAAAFSQERRDSIHLTVILSGAKTSRSEVIAESKDPYNS
jgi:hypothetical protein